MSKTYPAARTARYPEQFLPVGARYPEQFLPVVK